MRKQRRDDYTYGIYQVFYKGEVLHDISLPTCDPTEAIGIIVQHIEDRVDLTFSPMAINDIRITAIHEFNSSDGKIIDLALGMVDSLSTMIDQREYLLHDAYSDSDWARYPGGRSKFLDNSIIMSQLKHRLQKGLAKVFSHTAGDSEDDISASMVALAQTLEQVSVSAEEHDIFPSI